MNLLDTTRAAVADALSQAQQPIVACSFGRDSMLLLSLVREIRDIPVLWLRSGLLPSQRAFAESVIADWELTVIGFAPADEYLIPDGDSLSLISEFVINGQAFPLITDMAHGSRCVLDRPKIRTATMNYPWDVTLTGTRKCDTHSITGPDPLLDGLRWGPTIFKTPLRDLSDNDVAALTTELNISLNTKRYVDGDDLANPDVSVFCTNCVAGSGMVFCEKEQREIESFGWDRDGALVAFRSRFGFEGATG